MEWGSLLGSLFSTGGDVLKQKAIQSTEQNKTNAALLQARIEAQNKADAQTLASKNQTLLIGAGAAVLLALIIYKH